TTWLSCGRDGGRGGPDDEPAFAGLLRPQPTPRSHELVAAMEARTRALSFLLNGSAFRCCTNQSPLRCTFSIGEWWPSQVFDALQTSQRAMVPIKVASSPLHPIP